METVFTVITYSCAMYFTAYNIRDWLRPSVMFYIGGLMNDDDMARRGRAPWWLNRMAKKRLQNHEGETPLTIDANKRIMRSARLRIRTYVGCSRIVMYASPILLVLLPIKVALQFALEGYNGWTWTVTGFDAVWFWLAWQEIKNNGPWWKRKRDRLMEKVKQTLDGKLVVVPAGGSA